MDLFNLSAILSLDASKFDQGIEQANQKGQGLSKSLEKTFGNIKKLLLGAATIAAIKKGVSALASQVKAVAEYGDTVDKQSQKLGLSRRNYQIWSEILQHSGTSIEAMTGAMKGLNNALSSKEGGEALKQLGLSADELSKMSQEDAFNAVVTAFQKMPEGAEKSALAMKLFSKSGMELMPLLNTSSEDMLAMEKRAIELGAVMSDDMVAASAKFQDSLQDMGTAMRGVRNRVFSQFLPSITTVIEGITDFIAGDDSAFGKIESGIGSFVDKLSESLPQIISKGGKILGALGKGVSTLLKKLWPTISKSFGSMLKNLPGTLASLATTAADGVIDIINSAFGTNIPHIGELRWPTWDEVKQAAIAAWEGIKKGLETLVNTVGKFVFGETDTGAVKWPTWDEVRQAAIDAWNGIISGLSQLTNELGAFVFGKRDDGSVKWPTWGEVGAAARSALEGIAKGLSDLVTSVGEFIFGKREDGALDWPTWEDVKQFAEDAWTGIRDGLSGLADFLGGFVFGVRDDGAVKWPTWDEVKQAAEDAWNSIKTGLANLAVTLGGWIFGDSNPDGLTWLEEIKSWLDGSKALGIALDIGAKVSEWIETIANWAKNGINVLVSFFSNGLNNNQGYSGVTQGYADTLEKNGVAVDQWNNADQASQDWYFQYLRQTGQQAKGMDYVPHDDYVTRLHRGEAVLSGNEARAWRERGGRGQNYDGTSAIVTAIQGLSNDLSNLRLYVGQRAFAGAVVDYSGQQMSDYLGSSSTRTRRGYGRR